MTQRIYSYLAAITVLLLLPALWGSLRPKATILALGLFVLGMMVWSIFHYRIEGEYKIPRLMVPALLLLGYQGLMIFQAPVPAYGLRWLTSTLAILLLFFFMVNTIRDEPEAHRWLNVFLIIGTILVLVDLFFLLTWYLDWWGISTSILEPPPIRMRSPGLLLGHPNFFAAYLNLFIPFFLMRAFQTRKWRRIAWLVPSLLFLNALFFTASRSAWLALGGSILAMTAAISLPPLIKTIKMRQGIPVVRFNKKHGVLIAAVFLVGLAITPIFVNQIQSTAHGSASERLDIWAHALKLIAASPILGHGPGSSPFLYVLRSDAIGGDEVYHAHNIWLHFLITGGIISLGIVIWITALIVRSFIRIWNNPSTNETRRFSLIAILGVGTVMAVHGLLDYTLDPTIFSISVLFILAILYYDAPTDEFIHVNGKAILSFVVILLVLYTGSVSYTLHGALPYWEGMASNYVAGWPESANALCRAARANQRMTYYSFQCNLANAFKAYEQGDNQALHSARSSQSETLEQDPYWFLHWANLASYEWREGDQQEALLHMNKAAEMAPKMSFLWLNLAWMEEETEDRDNAHVHYLRAICANPWYRDYPFFQKNLLRKEVLESDCPTEFDSLSINPAQKYLWEGSQALKGGDLANAKDKLELARSADPNSSLPYALLGLIYQKNNETARAKREIRTALFLDNSSVRVLLAAAEIARDQGNDNQSLEYITQAFTNLKSPMYSRRYYLVAYHSPNLTTDLSPFLLKIGIPPEIREPLLYLTEGLKSQGKISESQEIIGWIERQSPP
jgi:O-antigen ligase/Tfp pilus assembly protein PilF